jgi:hypothetical protein
MTREKCNSSKSNQRACIIKHKIQLQLSDSSGFPVIPASGGTFCSTGTDTRFWVDLEIEKRGRVVTIFLPLINIQVGQVSPSNPFCPSGQSFPGLPPSGGYIYTSDGYLPKELRPTDPCPRSVVVPSNVGMSPVFSYAQDPCTLPKPPAGYILEVRDDGSINIQCAGTFGNIIPIGPHVILPCSISYITKKRHHLCKNVVVSNGATNVAVFDPTTYNANIEVRDSHTMAAYNNKIVWTWADNSMIPDKTIGVTNVMVSVGSVVPGTSTVSPGVPVQLTNFETQYPAHQFLNFDTGVAIVYAGPFAGRVIVSYGTVDPNFPASTSNVFIYTCRAISLDGGLTWPPAFDGVNNQPLNGKTNIQPTGQSGAGDIPGVLSDRFGNIFYITSNHLTSTGGYINQVTIWTSADGGDTFSILYSVPVQVDVELMDFPTGVFGTKADGQYGLYFTATFGFLATSDAFASAGFIPIDGYLAFGTPEFSTLEQLAPALMTPDIAASNDGRVWIQGNNSGVLSTPYSFIQPMLIAFKSPSGTIGQNWAGAWDLNVANNISATFADNFQVPPTVPLPLSAPVRSYALNSNISILFDDSRQVLYAMFNRQAPDFGQNMIISLVISGNNGMTWSSPIDIATSQSGNRGFQSMTLDYDPATQRNTNLIFGWYDGRNDPTFQSVEYYTAVIGAQELDKLVSHISVSNPNFLDLTKLVVQLKSSDGLTDLLPPITATFTGNSPQNTVPISAVGQVTNPTDACSPLVGFTPGNIAVVKYDRACGSRRILTNTETAGAVATVLIVCCGVATNAFGGTTTQTTAVISEADGALLVNALAQNPGAIIEIKLVPITAPPSCLPSANPAHRFMAGAAKVTGPGIKNRFGTEEML